MMKTKVAPFYLGHGVVFPFLYLEAVIMYVLQQHVQRQNYRVVILSCRI